VIKKLTSYLIITLVFAAYTGSSLGLQLELKDTKAAPVAESSTGEDTQGSTTLSISPFNAIYQPGHLVFQSSFSFEFELPDETHETTPEPLDATPHDTPYYKTLFGRIIVPNAP
jgi:hypothetical protein